MLAANAVLRRSVRLLVPVACLALLLLAGFSLLHNNIQAAGTSDVPVPLVAWPGPDPYGYRGCTVGYCWQEITSTLIPNLNHGSAVIPVGFTFPFYSGAYTQMRVDSNGDVQMGTGYWANGSNVCPLPGGMGLFHYYVPVMWDNITMEYGAVYYKNFNPCPIPQGTTVQCLVVEYKNATHFDDTPVVPGSAGTWEVIFYENGDIIMQFQNPGGESGSGSTTGIDWHYLQGWSITYACNSPGSLSPESAIQFYPPSSSCATVNPCPLAVKLTSFEAAPAAGGMLVAWETASEHDNAGFSLYRSVAPDGPGTQLNVALIPSRSPGGDQGATYDWLDTTAVPGVTYSYTLEDVDVNGMRTPHGPVAAALWRVYLSLATK